MRALIQRVSEAKVDIDGVLKSSIGVGILVLLGIENGDGVEDVDWLVRKITQMRIFGDQEGKMNNSILDVDGDMLVVSQFTLHASTKKGNRPSFIRAAKPEVSIPLYNKFVKKCSELLPVKTGEFGADMQVFLTNDGPVTIWLDSNCKE